MNKKLYALCFALILNAPISYSAARFQHRQEISPLSIAQYELLPLIYDNSIVDIQSRLKVIGNLDFFYEDGSTPLMEAIKYSKPEIVKILLQAGASVWMTNNDGDNALEYAQKEFEKTTNAPKKKEYQKIIVMLEKAMKQKQHILPPQPSGMGEFLQTKTTKPTKVYPLTHQITPDVATETKAPSVPATAKKTTKGKTVPSKSKKCQP